MSRSTETVPITVALRNTETAPGTKPLSFDELEFVQESHTALHYKCKQPALEFERLRIMRDSLTFAARVYQLPEFAGDQPELVPEEIERILRHVRRVDKLIHKLVQSGGAKQ